MNSKLLSIIAVFIGILLPMKVSAQMGDYISAPEFTFEGDNIVMTCETQGANIYYVMSEFANEEEAYSLSEALDVSEANSMRTLYTQPFPVTSNVVIKAVAKMPQQQGESEVTTLIYSYTAWSGLLSAIEYGSKVQERAKDSPLVSDDLKEHLQWALEEGQMIYGYRGQMPDSHEAEHFAEEILQIAHEIEEILNQQPQEPEPYAVLSQNNTVLTFYYDANRSAFQGSMDVKAFSFEIERGWHENASSITTVVFDESFANCTTITRTSFWFNGCVNLTTITGINNLKTDNVTDMRGMFCDCSSLESLDLSNFNTAKVKDFYGFLARCSSLTNINLSSFDTSSATTMADMFNGCTKLVSLNLRSFNTENVTDMIQMFNGCSSLANVDVSSFNTSNVTSMATMFAGCSSLTELDVTNFNTSKVTDIMNMFWGCSKLTSLDVSHFDTSNMENIRLVFAECPSLINLDLSNFNTSKVTSMGHLFYNCSSLTTIYVGSEWTTENVQTRDRNSYDFVFEGCTSLKGGAGTVYSKEHIDYTYAHIDGGRNNPGYFTDKNAPAIAEVMLTGKNANYWYDKTGTDPNGDEAVVFTLPENPDGGNFWEVNVLTAFIRNQLAFTTPEGEAVDNITGEFRFESEGNMVALNDGKMLMYESADEQGEMAMIEPGMGMMRIINNEITQRLLNEPNSHFMALPVNVMAYQDGKEVPVINGRFTVLVRLEKQQKEPEPYAVLSQNNTVLTFYYDTNKERMNGMDIGQSDQVAQRWYEQRESITKVVFDASFANCTTLTRTELWFTGCKNLVTIEGIGNLNTDNVTDMSGMFNDCSSLTSLDLSNFKTGNVTDMSHMFDNCSKMTTIDLSGFNTDNVTNMYCMFFRCSSLTSLDVSRFNTENVTDMYGMFCSCSSLTSLDVSNFKTDNVTNMGIMFSSCSNLTSLDLSNFKTDNVTLMTQMFYNCSALTTIFVGDGWSTANVREGNSMFERCTNLVGGAGTRYDANHVDYTYAHIDGGENNPGYLTTYIIVKLISGENGEMDTTIESINGTWWESLAEKSSTLLAVPNGSTIRLMFRPYDGFEVADVLLNGVSVKDQMPTNTTFVIEKVTENMEISVTYAALQAEPYAVLSRNSTVMTFYYDDQMAERGGISLDDDRWEGWERELSSSIVALVFDESFSDFVVNEAEDFNINLAGWTSLAAVRAGNVRIPAEEYAKVGNPNLLIYVNEPSLAPQGVQNVVVNGLAREIVLTNATEGNNNWHCPEPFRAEKITYTRNFRQQTEVGISRGWESIALPFTVQTITHETQGRIIPFGAQGSGKYFWLRGYSPEGLHRATVLEANTPYVISMPNNPTVYPAQYNLNGRVTFSAEDTTVPATPEFEEMLITRGNITMAPIFVVVPQDEAVYAINVSQPLDRYAEGSVFARELREVRPFEAATTHEPVNGARPKYIRIAAQPDDDITGIRTIELDETEGTWYSLDGRQMQGQPQRKGVYLQKGKKIVVK